MLALVISAFVPYTPSEAAISRVTTRGNNAHISSAGHYVGPYKPGGTYNFNVTVVNTGKTIWTKEKGYKLGIKNHRTDPNDMQYPNFNAVDIYGITRIELTKDVKPGESHTFIVTGTINPNLAIDKEVVYRVTWQMVEEGKEWFGAVLSSPEMPILPNNDATLSIIGIPGEMTIGQEYVLRVEAKNTGSTTWTEANRFRLGLLSHQTAPNKINPPDTYNATSVFGIESGRAKLAKRMPPGESYTFRITVTPRLINNQREYFMRWKMVKDDSYAGAEDGEWFGNTVTKKITLVDPVISQVAKPTFSPEPKTYNTAQNVTITTATTGANIRYTTNGTAPTCSTGKVYGEPINVSTTTTFKAIGCKTGMTASDVAKAKYTISQNCYTLTTLSSPSGGGTISATPSPNCTTAAGAAGYTYNTLVTIRAAANQRYSFSTWTGNIFPNNDPRSQRTVRMNRNISVTANFTQSPNIDR